MKTWLKCWLAGHPTVDKWRMGDPDGDGPCVLWKVCSCGSVDYATTAVEMHKYHGDH